jgi:hypothetical protein
MRLQRHLTRVARVPIRQLFAKASHTGDFQNSRRVGIARLFPSEGEIMPCATAGRILVAGHTSPSTSFTLKQLEREGCAVQSVDTIAEAESSLRAARFDIVLAGEILSDGRGCDLTDSVVNCSATLLVAITLSEACLFQPHGLQWGTLYRSLLFALLFSAIRRTPV